MEPCTSVIPDARGWRGWGGDQVPSAGVDVDEEPRPLLPLRLVPWQKRGPGLWVVKLSDPSLTNATRISECVAKHSIWLINCLKSPEEDGDCNTCFWTGEGLPVFHVKHCRLYFPIEFANLLKFIFRYFTGSWWWGILHVYTSPIFHDTCVIVRTPTIDGTRGFECFDSYTFGRKGIVLFQDVALSGHQWKSWEWQEEKRETTTRCLQKIGYDNQLEGTNEYHFLGLLN